MITTTMSEPVSLTNVVACLERQATNAEQMQMMALQMGNMLTRLSTGQLELKQQLETEAKKRDSESSEMRLRLERLENTTRNVTSTTVNALDANPALRYALRYLMTGGMDTRTGIVCAFPVRYLGECYVAISLHLLKYSHNRVFKRHPTKGRAISDFARAFYNIDATAPAKLAEKASTILPIVLSVTRRSADTWAALKATQFVQLCMELDERYPVDDNKWNTDHLWNDDETVKELDMPARMKKDNSSADDYTKKEKIAWNVPVWRDILLDPAVEEFYDVVARAKDQDVPVGATHFCGIQLYPAVTVEDHPRMPVRCGKGPESVHEARQRAQSMQDEDSSSSEGSADDDVTMEGLLKNAEEFTEKRHGDDVVDSDDEPVGKKIKQ